MRLSTFLTLALGVGLVTAAVQAQQVQQPRGGGSEWLTPRADAQQTSWVRTDTAISVDALSKPGFALQWKTKLDNAPRQGSSLTQGVSANGVTLFVPMSLIAGSSNNVYALDGDTGFPVWERHIDAPLPASASAACPGGITGAPTRIVELVQPPVMASRAGAPGRGGRGYTSLLSEPGEGAPNASPAVAPPPAPPAAAAAAPPAAPGRGQGGGGGGQAGRGGGGGIGVPGAPAGLPSGGFGRPAGVVYVVASDGQLHVLGLPSGKDIQKPAPFLPANARFSDLIAVGETLYATTGGNCGGAPNGVWSIDLAAEAKPVTSWKTNGGSIVGSVAFGSDGTIFATVGPGQAAAGGYANAIVALDSKTLAPKNWFTQATTEFVTGPLVFKRGDKDIVAAATKDGRILLLDGAAVGGANHTTTIFASKPVTSTPATFAPDALTLWQQMLPPAAVPAPAAPPAGAPPAGQGQAPATPMQPGQMWLLVPVAGTVSADMRGSGTGPAPAGVVVALKVTDGAATVSLEPGWTSRGIASPATPLVINGVVFAVASGKPAAAGGRGTPAVIYALDGMTGKELWNSGTTIASYMAGRSFWAANSQVVLSDSGGTVYSFGYEMERR